MSTSVHVSAFTEPSEAWLRYKAIHDACKAAGVEIPYEVTDVVGDNPTAYGRETYIVPVEGGNDNQEWFDIELSTLPTGTTHVRLKISY